VLGIDEVSSNIYIQFFLKKPQSRKCRLELIFDSLTSICNVSTKSVLDPHFYKNVSSFLGLIV
jgi:hypothetical protein